MKYTLLKELNYQDLEKRTTGNFGNSRKINSQRVQISNIIYVPSPETDILQVIADTKTTGDTYKTIVVFDNVNLSLDRIPNSVGFISPSGVKYYFHTISKTDDVKVTCSCLDFYYRFAVWNKQKDALYGEPPPPYIKTTDRPYVNPFKTPGVCKHIIKVMDRLKRRRFFT